MVSSASTKKNLFSTFGQNHKISGIFRFRAKHLKCFSVGENFGPAAAGRASKTAISWSRRLENPRVMLVGNATQGPGRWSTECFPSVVRTTFRPTWGPGGGYGMDPEETDWSLALSPEPRSQTNAFWEALLIQRQTATPSATRE